MTARLTDALAAEDTAELAGDPRWNATFNSNTTDASPLLRFQSSAADPKLAALSSALRARNVTTAAYDLQLLPAPPPDDAYWLRAAALLQGGLHAAAAEGTAAD